MPSLSFTIVIMLGIGVAENSGYLNGLIRKVVKITLVEVTSDMTAKEESPLKILFTILSFKGAAFFYKSASDKSVQKTSKTISGLLCCGGRLEPLFA